MLAGRNTSDCDLIILSGDHSKTLTRGPQRRRGLEHMEELRDLEEFDLTDDDDVYGAEAGAPTASVMLRPDMWSTDLDGCALQTFRNSRDVGVARHSLTLSPAL